MDRDFNERLGDRLNSLAFCKTPEELSFDIWSENLDEAIGSRKSYRDAFVNWIKSYKEGTEPQWNKYKTPKELCEAIWPPRLDYNEKDRTWFGALRVDLEKWIENYKKEEDGGSKGE